MKQSCRSHAFTLIEMVAAMALLAILALMIAGIVEVTRRSSSQSNQAIDGVVQARLAFDRIALDLASLVRRGDVDISIGKTGIFLQFVSTVTSAGLDSTTNRGISVVAYEMGPNPENGNRTCLLRAGKAIRNDEVGFMGLKADGMPVRFTDAAFPATLLPATAADFDVLGAGVIRTVVGFQLYPDNQPVVLADGTNIPNARGQIVYSPPTHQLTPDGGVAVTYVDVSRISALVFGCVSVDLDSLYLVNPAQVDEIAARFVAPATGITPVQAWTAVANNDSAPTDVPLKVRHSIRVSERFFPIRPYPSPAL